MADFSTFAKFEENKRKSNLLMPFLKIGNQMDSFRQMEKIRYFPLLSADSRYFRIYAVSFLNFAPVNACNIDVHVN